MFSGMNKKILPFFTILISAAPARQGMRWQMTGY
jgi:hypothetical protein